MSQFDQIALALGQFVLVLVLVAGFFCVGWLLMGAIFAVRDRIVRARSGNQK